MSLTLPLLPIDVLLNIVVFLHLQDILVLRQTCTVLRDVSCHRSVWFSVLCNQKADLPLPRSYRNVRDLATSGQHSLEDIAVAVHKTECNWSRRRSRLPHTISPRPGSMILLLEVLFEKWLVGVYCEGLICVWDLITHQHHARFAVGSKGWSSCAITARGSLNDSCVIALTRAGGETTILLFCVQFPTENMNVNATIKLTQKVQSTAQTVRAIHPDLPLVILSRSLFVESIDWEQGSSASPWTFRTLGEELEELWNGIVVVRCYGPYMFVVKTHSLEAYYVSADSTTRPRVIRHPLSNATFRYAAISAPIASAHAISLSILAYDVALGLTFLNFVVSLVEGTAEPSYVDVQRVGCYTMTTSSPPGDEPSGPTHAFGSAVGPLASGFVSACALGPEGKRGVWVERLGRNMRRVVRVFSVHTESQPQEFEMEGNVVYEVTSYDLQEDITHCALSEVTGTIVLGTRSGDIRILEI